MQRISTSFGIFCAALALTTEGYGMYQCIGPSMLPTLYSRDFVLVDHFTHKWLKRPYKAGDIVVSISPTDPGMLISKRIMGMPGDLIVKDPLLSNIRREYVEIPPGHVWLQGDNFTDSTDSRVYGPVPLGLIKGGRLVFRFWPSSAVIRNGFDETQILLDNLQQK